MLVTPLQERMDDWKKVAVQLDKEHGKGRLMRRVGYNSTLPLSCDCNHFRMFNT